MIDLKIENTFAFRVGGKITEAEMALALSATKEKIDVHEEPLL